MAIFSQRNGYNTDTIKPESASDTLKKRIYASFYKEEFYIYDLFEQDTTGIEDMMIEMGISVDDIMNELKSRHVIDHKVKQEKMV